MATKRNAPRGGGASSDDESGRDGGGDADHGVEKLGEVPEAPKIGTAVLFGNTFGVRTIQYLEIDGMAVVEGDIALGSVAEVERTMDLLRDPLNEGIAFGVGISGAQFRWPDCRIPYEIDPNLPNQQRVTGAIAHWESNTSFRFIVRTTEVNHVFFTDANGCWSLVGMRGGRQTISLGAGCSLGNAIHEIGHTVGLWHEQSREDRDQFVTINWQNIVAGMESQFAQHIADGDDLGPYDYGSIMHYPRTAFSRNGLDTITPVDAAAQIGQRDGLSAGDIGAVRQMYPTCGGVFKPPWNEKVKPLGDPLRFKKILDDHRILKSIRDPLKPPRDPGPIKLAGFDVPPFLRGIVNPLVNPNPAGGGRLPFTLATGHHANVGDAEIADAAESIISALQMQMFEVEAAIARAQVSAAEAGLELHRLEGVRDAIATAYTDALGGE